MVATSPIHMSPQVVPFVQSSGGLHSQAKYIGPTVVHANLRRRQLVWKAKQSVRKGFELFDVWLYNLPAICKLLESPKVNIWEIGLGV